MKPAITVQTVAHMAWVLLIRSNFKPSVKTHGRFFFGGMADKADVSFGIFKERKALKL